MLQILQPLVNKGHDVYTFFPSENPDDITISAVEYSNRGELVDNSSIGDCYHIILFKEGKNSITQHLDYYDAILLDPLEYMSMLIPQGWYGMIGKKTTTSSVMFNDSFDKIKSTC